MLQLLYMRRQTLRSLLVLALYALALAAWLAPATAAQDRTPDAATYEAWLREAFAAARRGDRLGLEAVAARLATTREVRLDDGTTVAVENHWLSDALAVPDPDLNTIAARLGAIIDALALPPSSAPADAVARLEQILDAPPFNRPPPAPPPQWLVDALDWLVRVIESILRPVGVVPPAAANTVAWFIALAGIVALASVIIYLLIGVRRGIIRDAHPVVDGSEERISAAAARDQAGDLARSGDYRTAVRLLYLSALLWLDEQGLLRYDRALTNREYLERVRDAPELHTRLAPVVETFDRVWYGHLGIDRAAFEAYRDQIETLRRDLA